MNKILISTSLVVIMALFTIIVLPFSASANYTFAGHTFETRTELQHYFQEYMAVWRELYGTSDTSDTETTTASAVENTRSAFTIRTSRVDDVTMTEALLVGRINFKNSDLVKIWFDYGLSPTQLTYRTVTETLDQRTFGSSKFDREVRNLTHDTTYYYRAAGLNEDGAVVYGDIEDFETAPDPRNSDAEIYVQTKRATHIDENRAALWGSVRLKDTAYGYVWFEHGEDEHYLDSNTEPVRITPESDRNFGYTIHHLEEAETYYYRMVGIDTNSVKNYGKTYKFTTKRDVLNEKPKIDTYRAANIGFYSAQIIAEVDMNDFRNGTVFFLYGESKEEIQDVAADYHSYKRIREEGDNLQKVLVDDDHDKYRYFFLDIENLDLDTKHYFTTGLEYENDNDEQVILFGRIQSFTTKDIR